MSEKPREITDQLQEIARKIDFCQMQMKDLRERCVNAREKGCDLHVVSNMRGGQDERLDIGILLKLVDDRLTSFINARTKVENNILLWQRYIKKIEEEISFLSKAMNQIEIKCSGTIASTLATAQMELQRRMRK